MENCVGEVQDNWMERRNAGNFEALTLPPLGFLENGVTGGKGVIMTRPLNFYLRCDMKLNFGIQSIQTINEDDGGSNVWVPLPAAPAPGAAK